MNLSLTNQAMGVVAGETQPNWQYFYPTTQNNSPVTELEAALLRGDARQAIQSTVEQEQFARLRAAYVLDEPAAVIKFLKNHRALAGLLLDAFEPLRECFGSDRIFQLRTQTDEDAPTLYVLVLWTGPLSSAKRSRELFDDSWWLRNSYRALGNVVFDYELR